MCVVVEGTCHYACNLAGTMPHTGTCCDHYSEVVKIRTRRRKDELLRYWRKPVIAIDLTINIMKSVLQIQVVLIFLDEKPHLIHPKT